MTIILDRLVDWSFEDAGERELVGRLARAEINLAEAIGRVRAARAVRRVAERGGPQRYASSGDLARVRDELDAAMDALGVARDVYAWAVDALDVFDGPDREDSLDLTPVCATLMTSSRDEGDEG